MSPHRYWRVGDAVSIVRVARPGRWGRLNVSPSCPVRLGDVGVVLKISYENRKHHRKRQWVVLRLVRNARGQARVGQTKYPGSWLRASPPIEDEPIVQTAIRVLDAEPVEDRPYTGDMKRNPSTDGRCTADSGTSPEAGHERQIELFGETPTGAAPGSR